MFDKENSYVSHSSVNHLDMTDIEGDSEEIILHKQRKSWDETSFAADPEHVLENFRNCLAPFELDEITQYSHIYCISDLQHKLKSNTVDDYVDNNGKYKVIAGDHIRYRYQIIEVVGTGSYAQVIKAYDHKSHNFVAIKMMCSTHNGVASTEATVLEYIKQHDGCTNNLIELKKRFFFRNFSCFVFEFAKTTLYNHVKEHGSLDLSTIKRFATQILQGLKFLRSHGIIHCDVKAENILLVENPTTKQLNVKLADFGLSCFDHEDLYAEVQSLWCRAPEVILETEYDTKIDMWSFGCVLTFMYTGKYIFKGEGAQDQLLAIMEVFGVPCSRLVEESQIKDYWFSETGRLLANRCKGRKTRVPNSICLGKVLEGAEHEFVEFVKHCLKMDPRERFSPEDALKDHWVAEKYPQCKVELDEVMPIEREPNAVRIPCSSNLGAPSRNMFQIC